MWISFIARKYKIRHQILQHLYNKIENDPLHKIDLPKSMTLADDLAGILKVTTNEIKKYHMSFHDFEKEQNHVKCSAPNDAFTMTITESGVIACLDDYWLREGRKDLNDKIYNLLKWIMPILSLIISTVALLISAHVIQIK